MTSLYHFVKSFIRNQSGVAIIEMAFILPILLLFTFGAIEFGMFFLKANMNSNNVAAAAAAVQNDPGDPSNINLLMQGSLLSSARNEYCAMSYLTFQAAENGGCVNGRWETLEPPGMPAGQTAYFVVIRSSIESRSLSGLFDEGGMFGDLMPDNERQQVIKVSTSSNNVCTGQVSKGTSVIAPAGTPCIVALYSTNDDEGKNYTTSECNYNQSTGTITTRHRNARKTRCSYACFGITGACPTPTTTPPAPPPLFPPFPPGDGDD